MSLLPSEDAICTLADAIRDVTSNAEDSTSSTRQAIAKLGARVDALELEAGPSRTQREAAERAIGHVAALRSRLEEFTLRTIALENGGARPVVAGITPTMVTCSECGATLTANEWDAHRWKVHSRPVPANDPLDPFGRVKQTPDPTTAAYEALRAELDSVVDGLEKAKAGIRAAWEACGPRDADTPSAALSLPEFVKGIRYQRDEAKRNLDGKRAEIARLTEDNAAYRAEISKAADECRGLREALEERRKFTSEAASTLQRSCQALQAFGGIQGNGLVPMVTDALAKLREAVNGRDTARGDLAKLRAAIGLLRDS